MWWLSIAEAYLHVVGPRLLGKRLSYGRKGILKPLVGGHPALSLPGGSAEAGLVLLGSEDLPSVRVWMLSRLCVKSWVSEIRAGC